MPEKRRAFGGIEIPLPGRRRSLQIDCVVFDFNGTLAVDGRLVEGASARLRRLAKLVSVVVMTADTFGTVRDALAGMPVTIEIVRTGDDKRRYIESVGGKTVIAVGNGVNDAAMFRAAALGIAVCGAEGMSAGLLRAASIVVHDVNDALDLLLRPRRLLATLRK